jgi:alpha-1,3-rhamnosyl/mannosyltransferase
MTIRLALRTASRIVADSEATARDLERRLGMPRERISVVWAAADPAFKPASGDEVASLRSKCHLPDNFALYMGSNKPHKNLRLLVQALAVTPADQRFELVIAGQWDQRVGEPKMLAVTHGVDQHITWLGPVAQSVLPALYSAASVFVFPSEYEGFGLPVLEAMACGTPVICSNASSLPEVAGDAALMLPPGEHEAWSAAIRAVLNNTAMRIQMTSAGLRRAQSFSWAAAARQMLEIYAAV